MADDTSGVEMRATSEHVQGAYDYCEGNSAFIIADTAAEDAWIAVPEGEEACVETSR